MAAFSRWLFVMDQCLENTLESAFTDVFTQKYAIGINKQLRERTGYNFGCFDIIYMQFLFVTCLHRCMGIH